MKVGQSSEIFGSLQKRVFLRKPLERCQPYSFHNRLKVQKRGSSSHTNNNGEIVTAKGQTISLNKDSTTRVTSQFKTITTLFVELVKTNTPSFDLSLSSLAKRLPFQNVQTDIPKDNIANKKLEEKMGLRLRLVFHHTLISWEGRKKKRKKLQSLNGKSSARLLAKRVLLVRLEDFCHHLFQYPAAKSVASREGAISILLRLKHSIPRDELIQRQIREGLALLGYADPLPAKGIRILSIDGGGTRGLLALRILRHLEKISGKPIYESFDYICGVSTGAVLALLIGAAKKNVKDVETMYREISTEVFKQDRSSGLGGLLWSHAYYDTKFKLQTCRPVCMSFTLEGHGEHYV
ncbi:hypothetical protein DAPPUDRAFT_336563 [Daphnia pulex]|uniref:PNPLA domain-containing protein n=1 Tax=Daphnia pulex TaxID=6669 RepID=E9HZX2_DAPPU|nr:hypothetical protein DAPPUDRAFT_336563 [Daphnia pulex]|eukprot:EFX62708.1 hypothetical protein DAPPUDRAFT_336563 [Daphnia pulex]